MLKKICFLCLFVCCLIGCGSEPVQTKSGIIKNIEYVQEDGTWVQYFIEFEDNTVTRLRCAYYTPFTIKKGVKNTLIYQGTILLSSEIDHTKE